MRHRYCRIQHDIAHEHDGVHNAHLVVEVRAFNQQVGVLATHEPNLDADAVVKESVLHENSTCSRPIISTTRLPDMCQSRSTRQVLTTLYCVAPVCPVVSMYSSTYHELTPSGPGKSVRTLQVAAHQRDGWAR